MQYSLVVALCLFLVSVNTAAQSWKQAAQVFTVKQDDNKKTLFTLQLPAESKIDTAFNFATYVTDKTNLSISYELDDEPHNIKGAKKMSDADLLRYAKDLTNATIAGNDVKILNKKIASKSENINNLKTLLVQYDYLKKDQKGQERGKVFLYPLPVTGSSLVYDNEHIIIVKLSFDYTQPSDNTSNTLYKDIMGTLQINKE